MVKNQKILVSWASHPRYVPPPNFSDNQYNIYTALGKPLSNVDLNRNRMAKSHTYDLYLESKKFPDAAEFDLVIVQTGPGVYNKPVNLDAFKCPKILLVGDTHHLTDRPIRSVLDYMATEVFDGIVSLYNKDHIRWLRSFHNAVFGWFPGLTSQDIRRTWVENRKPRIFFAGSWRTGHPRRHRFITSIIQDKLPFEQQGLTRLGSAVYHADSAISFNCSLNSDLNMRVFECLSAAGFLLTDQLSSNSGINDYLVDGKDYVSYANYEDFKEKAIWYIGNPKAALKISSNGHQKYIENYSAQSVIESFLSWCFSLKGDHESQALENRNIDNVCMEKRLEIYEYAQLLQFQDEIAQVLAIGEIPSAVLQDLIGLSRKTLCSTPFSDNQPLSHQGVQYFNIAQITDSSWPLVIIDKENFVKLEINSITVEKVFTI